MTKLLMTLGLHIDQQSLTTLAAKVLAIAALVGTGIVCPAVVAYAGFGIVLSMAAEARIIWWCMALTTVVAYFAGKKTSDRV